MKNVVYFIPTLLLFLSACSNDIETIPEETAIINFTSNLPKKINSRNGENTSIVEQVVCAVFEKDAEGNIGNEISGLRQTIDVINNEISYAPTLIRGRSYQIVFWASNKGKYTDTDLSAIPCNKTSTDFEAFTATTSIMVNESATKEITLKRPFSKVNLGVTNADWEKLVETAGTPTHTVIKIKGYNFYNAVKGTPINIMEEGITDEMIEMELSQNIMENQTLTIDEIDYKHLTTYYLLTDGNVQSFTYSIYAEDEKLCENTISNVPMKANSNTNIVGNLATSTITYNVKLDSDFETDNNGGNEEDETGKQES